MPRADPAIRWAVLCSSDDPSGPWVARGLRARGLDGVRVVTSEELVYSTRINHEVSATRVRSAITLGDGAVLGPDLRGTVNRVTRVPSAHLARASPGDQEYAVQELYALLTSVLHGLPGVIANRPDARGLSGPWLRPPEWMTLGARAGLRGAGYRSAGHDPVPAQFQRSVAVVGPEVVAQPLPAVPALGRPVTSSPPDRVRQGCLRLAQSQDLLILGVDFAVVDGVWLLCGASPVPDLRTGGDALLDAVHAVLT